MSYIFTVMSSFIKGLQYIARNIHMAWFHLFLWLHHQFPVESDYSFTLIECIRFVSVTNLMCCIIYDILLNCELSRVYAVLNNCYLPRENHRKSTLAASRKSSYIHANLCHWTQPADQLEIAIATGNSRRFQIVMAMVAGFMAMVCKHDQLWYSMTFQWIHWHLGCNLLALNCCEDTAIYWHFLSLHNTGIMQIIKIFHHRRQ